MLTLKRLPRDLPFLPIIHTHKFFCSSIQPHYFSNHPNQTPQTQNHTSLLSTLNLFRTINPSLLSITNLHSLALKLGSLTNPHTTTSFLVLYAKSHNLHSAHKLFDEMPTRDVISWNAMINAYVCNGSYNVALELFREMWVKEKCGIDSTTLVVVVSAVSRLGELKQGRVLHGVSLKCGMGSDCFLGNAFIDMYAKSGELSCAECVFEGMEFRDTSSWNSIMSGCVRNGCAEMSLSYFKEMFVFGSGVRADHLSVSCVISACFSLGEIKYGQTVHGLTIKLGYEDTGKYFIGNSLISLYSRCGDIYDAESVFRELVHKDDVVSWNSMIHGFAKEGLMLEALNLLHEMQVTYFIQPDSVTLLSVIPLCAEFNLLQEGRSVHGFIIRRQMNSNVSLVNSIMDMYFKCKFTKPAEILFANLQERDLVSWSTTIAGYSQNDYTYEAQTLFKEFLCSGMTCGVLTLLGVLSSCNSPEKLQFGKSLHGFQFKFGFVNSFLITNACMFMYINCGDLMASVRLLRSISVAADVVSWNTVIVGCAQNGYAYEALEVFNQMLSSSYVKPDNITIVNALSACGELQLILDGKFLHGFTYKTPIGLDVRVRNSLITMYSRCEDVESANLVFTTSPNHNLCSWNCMISGFAQNKDGRSALELFQHLNYTPNEFTIVSILSASTQIGSLKHGKQIHGYVLRFGFQRNMFIFTALVDMYSKCGRLDISIQLFRYSSEKFVASWNCMISAYGLHGYGREAIKVFIQMCEAGTTPTKSTFISLLSACSHSGLIEEGCMYYKLMSSEYGVEPTTEHHVCFVDMLGRSGKLVEAYKFVENLKPQADMGVWGALLGACKYHENTSMGKQVAEHLFKSHPEHAGCYVSLFNMYAADGRWSDAMDVRRILDDRMLRKPPGYSLVDVCLG